MTQVTLCSWDFLIFHAVAFSFLSSGTLKTALPGQSDHLIFPHQSLINDKITALSEMEMTGSRTCDGIEDKIRYVLLTSYSNCFSTKPNNPVHVCATRLYHDNDKEADDETDYRNKCVGNQ